MEEKGNVKRLMYGMIRKQWKCVECLHVTQKEEIYNCSNVLDIKKKNPTLNECIQEDIRPEEIEYDCQKCSSMKAIQSTEIVDYPDILFIQIKRFASDGRSKVHDNIQIPMLLGDTNHELKSVIDHIGKSMDMGHSPNVKKKVMATFMMTNLQDQYQR